MPRGPSRRAGTLRSTGTGEVGACEQSLQSYSFDPATSSLPYLFCWRDIECLCVMCKFPRGAQFRRVQCVWRTRRVVV